jgi:hypothetical protein
MAAMKNSIGFDLVKIMTTFELNDSTECTHLNEWLKTAYELDTFEEHIIEDLFLDIKTSGEYMNEEELKARMVGLIFYTAKVDVPHKIRVFYERPISATVKNHDLAVITDCMVASPIKSSPQTPYFFLQEFKKAKGEKKDPEAQMLTAMLIAQEKNNDGKPLYGGYMIGTSWHFATLIDKNYCVSEKYEATQKSQLKQIVFILRTLKTLILNR